MDESTRTDRSIPLDYSQLAFSQEPTQAIRLLAPAGSGKTHSLLWRCMFASQQGSEEGNTRFLVFTFTRAARDELRDRLHSDPAFAGIAPFVEISTLNSWGFRRLKNRSHNLTLVTSKQEKFWCMSHTLQPEWIDRDEIKQAVTDSRRKSKATNLLMDLLDRFKSVGFRHDIHDSLPAFRAHIEWMHENGMGSHWSKIITDLDDIEVIQEDGDDPVRQVFDHFFPFWKGSIERMFSMKTITLEDQKYWASIDLERAIEEKKFTTGVHRYHHILVDEFQDVNPLDLELVKNIATLNKAELCIVGDDDQAIYEWRGATPKFILDPEAYIGYSYKTFILDRNYRSPANIVETSQRLIKHNLNRVDKNVMAVSTEQAHIEVVTQPDLDASIEYVLHEVQRLLAEGETRKIAIISRKRSQIIPYQIVFAGNDMEFYAAEDLQILLSDTFEDMKNMLMLKAQVDVAYPALPDPIEPVLKLCDKVKRYPLKQQDRNTLRNFLQGRRPDCIRQAAALVYEYEGPLKGDNRNRTMSVHFYEQIKEFIDAPDLASAIRALSDNFDGLQKDYGKSLDDIFYADPPFTFLADYAKRYGTNYGWFYDDVQKAISTLARIPPDDGAGGPPANTEWKCPLHLMTALRAKGKEFDVVFVLDCNEGIFPSKFAETPEQVEAERRLFYVAMTRAKKRLLFVVNDTMFGEPAFPSPFLAEAGLI